MVPFMGRCVPAGHSAFCCKSLVTLGPPYVNAWSSLSFMVSPLAKLRLTVPQQGKHRIVLLRAEEQYVRPDDLHVASMYQGVLFLRFGILAGDGFSSLSFGPFSLAAVT